MFPKMGNPTAGPRPESRVVSFNQNTSEGYRNTREKGVKKTGHRNEDLSEQIIYGKYIAGLDRNVIAHRFMSDVKRFYSELISQKPEKQDSELIHVGKNLLRLLENSVGTVANYSLSGNGFVQALTDTLNQPKHQHPHTEHQCLSASAIKKFLSKLAEFNSPDDQMMGIEAYVETCLHQDTSFADNDGVLLTAKLPPAETAIPSENRGLKRMASFAGNLAAMGDSPTPAAKRLAETDSLGHK
ncbi:MAG: hypothetical protein ACJAUP_002666 [Cellvibrionaceae bacterium]|jgi:hypothetical protein